MIKKLNDDFTSSSIIFYKPNETTNNEEESSSLKALRIRRDLIENKMDPKDKLRNIISIGPRNFSLEQQIKFRKQRRDLERAILNGYKGCINDDISNLMKKYSIL